jgi:PD-(D/E)XK endonuclease
MSTVNDRGAIGTAKIISDLLSRGYSVFLPFDGASPVDIIVANKEMQLCRVQAKYRKIDKSGSIGVSLESVVNRKRIKIDKSKVDAYAIYCPDTSLVYYLDLSIVPIKQYYVSLSVVDGPKRKNIASNFMDPSILWKVKSSGTAGAC